MTSADVVEFLNSREKKVYSEKDVSAAMDRLFASSDSLIHKVNFDAKKQLPVYIVEWQKIFKKFKF